MEAHTPVIGGGRSVLERSPLSRLPDRILKWGLAGVAVLVLVLIAYFFIRLIGESTPAFNRFGVFGFVFHNRWLPSRLIFGAAAMVFGTVVTSAIALIIGVPVAVATALYLTELCPRRARGALTILVDLLAAVPSVVYGLWGYLFLIPKLKPAEQWFADTFSFIPYVAGTVAGPSIFIAGLILAIMILPIVSAISREVISTVPAEHKEAALALGATRWEMIKMAVLPYSRPGITGGAMLGLGRALGETIAVLLVIGDDPAIPHFLFGQGYSLAAVIANEFGNESNIPIYRSALLACGLVLFVLTLLVNGFARGYVLRGERTMFRGHGGSGASDEPEVEAAMGV
ncbi:MAG TPA: phosphate ABC transporter permease subunit PstC [Solirubrobacteraceae bacterium]|nr:phosphate ABC transporter permease subunit PstC [Solirubrobacteraceae bacterium]